MDPLKNLRLRLEQGVVRAYESLTEGWRELLSRSSGALTHFDASAPIGTRRCLFPLPVQVRNPPSRFRSLERR